jgi:hypothetical protein
MPRGKKNEPVEAEVVEERKEPRRDRFYGRSSGRLIGGLILIVLGGMLIAQNLLNLNLFRYFGPIVLIIIGLSLIGRSVNY